MQGRHRGDGWRAANQAWDVIGILLAGICVWGGVGHALDRWFGLAQPVLLPIGMLLGAGAAVYLIARRYGTEDR